jgi:hypothetical protein
LAGTATAAPAAKSFNGSGHIPQLDGPVTTLTAPDGRTLAAWAYRASGEFDIAFTAREAGSGTWSAPVFFGRMSGADELDPSIAMDANGTVYVAFATSHPSRIELTVLPAGSNDWATPVVISGTDAASSPTLLVVGQHLVLGYKTARGVELVDLPLGGDGNQINGVQDGPDVSPSSGIKGSNLPPISTNGG